MRGERTWIHGTGLVREIKNKIRETEIVDHLNLGRRNRLSQSNGVQITCKAPCPVLSHWFQCTDFSCCIHRQSLKAVTCNSGMRTPTSSLHYWKQKEKRTHSVLHSKKSLDRLQYIAYMFFLICIVKHKTHLKRKERNIRWTPPK